MILQLIFKTHVQVEREKTNWQMLTSFGLDEGGWQSQPSVEPVTHLGGWGGGQASTFPPLEMSRLRSTQSSYIGVWKVHFSFARIPYAL